MLIVVGSFASHHLQVTLDVSSSFRERIVDECKAIWTSMTSSASFSSTSNVSVGTLSLASMMLFPNVTVKGVLLVERASFVVIELRQCRELHVSTYNVRPPHVKRLGRRLSKLVSWSRFRQHLLDCILHQKMGLFRHCSSMPPCPLDEHVVGRCQTVLRAAERAQHAQHARFTVDNIAVIIDNAVPPRQQQEAAPASRLPPVSSTSSSSSKSTATSTSRPAYFNRFEMRRRARSSVNKMRKSSSSSSSSTPLPSSPSSPSFEFASLLRGLAPSTLQLSLCGRRPEEGDVLRQHGRYLQQVAGHVQRQRDAQKRLQAAQALLLPPTTVTSGGDVQQQHCFQWAKRLTADSVVLRVLRAPLLFNRMRDRLFRPDLRHLRLRRLSQPPTTEQAREISLHHRILEAFLQDFVKVFMSDVAVTETHRHVAVLGGRPRLPHRVDHNAQ